MKAKVGDWIVVEGLKVDDGRRQGEVRQLLHADGSPPYRVHWVDTGQETVFYPGPDARVEPHPVAPAVRVDRRR